MASTSSAAPPTGDPSESSTSAGQPASKSQKSMTKAERRELQEKQRAAKAAKATEKPTADSGAKQPQGGNNNKQTPTAGSGTTSRRAGRTGADGAPSRSAAPSKPIAPSRSAIPSGGGRASKDKDSSIAGDDSRREPGLRIFSHFGLPKPVSGKGDIHPAITRLALQFSEFKITGANARCIATLTAFKTVIQDYVTPPGTTLSRHLMTHLSPQIYHLVAARPMSVTMGNAIRELKLEISSSDIDLPEQDAKDELCHKIDNYIRDRIIVAGEVIQDTAGKKIKDGDVIVTYARSSIVERVLLNAHREGRDFSVIVVDSRPMLEGKRLLAVLSKASIPCTYILLPSLGSVIVEASMVMLGAHSLHSNGSVFSRAGTALVAMMAQQHSVPVMVCCETYKFSEGVQLDSFTKNELAPLGPFLSTFPTTRPREALTLQARPNLEILNPLYDLTPPTSITAVVTEVGIIPPDSISSIPLALGRQSI